MIDDAEQVTTAVYVIETFIYFTKGKVIQKSLPQKL